MKKSKSLYRGHRFPTGVISCAVRWYFRCQLNLRDIEELLFERGVTVTYETPVALETTCVHDRKPFRNASLSSLRPITTKRLTRVALLGHRLPGLTSLSACTLWKVNRFDSLCRFNTPFMR